MIDRPSVSGPAPTTSQAGPPGTDRRSRQRERRRAELYEVAIELFVEKTFDGTTMEDIAERADVARATVFNYFPRKVAFLQEWAVRRRERATTAARSGDPSASSLRDVLLRYFTEMGRLADGSRDVSVAVIIGSVHTTDIWRRSPIAAELAEFVRAAKDTGELEPHIDADRAGLYLSASYYVILTAWAVEDPAPFDLTAELTTMVDTVLYGILPRPS
ncbi:MULTISPECIES: TetR/AcrR family transcriptional regulator [unclassified Streptomyces]|uniref:TetR/AcrR family transcriptional regulator n=1 Tax=unclassified Streptomyces TaxID=2593676 RepID=UPI00380D3C15